ncbi:DUF3846 domain-containing protein [Streptomyces sp. NPDC018007]|uniref:DUF3846 domain-containing protein n=1 Tax=Streptomyces sp. NPDC018007 TaxID=3365029 RepID=UPI00378770BD
MSDAQQDRFALVLRPDGVFKVIDWPKDGHLPILYREIGCTAVDVVDLSRTLSMWLDDEGLINGSDANCAATILYALHHAPHQTYHGTVVLTGGTDRHGDTLGLTKDKVAELLEFHLTFSGARIPSQRTK